MTARPPAVDLAVYYDPARPFSVAELAALERVAALVGAVRGRCGDLLTGPDGAGSPS